MVFMSSLRSVLVPFCGDKKELGPCGYEQELYKTAVLTAIIQDVMSFHLQNPAVFFTRNDIFLNIDLKLY